LLKTLHEKQSSFLIYTIGSFFMVDILVLLERLVVVVVLLKIYVILKKKTVNFS